MRDIAWDNDSAVTEVSGELVIAGETVTASDLSVSRSIPSNLPAQVAGVGGYTAATGSATTVPASPVSDRSPTPWGSETPQPLAGVEAFALSGGQRARVFLGAVDKVSGAASEGEVSLGLVDQTDRLNRAVSIPPLAQIMPAPTTDGSTVPMNVGLVSSYLVDRVLRECGYFATPPMPARTVLSVPLTGSTFPEVGRIITSRRDATWKEQPYFSRGWHAPLGNRLYAEYEPQLDGRHAEGNLTRPMEISLSAANTHEDSCRISTEWGNGAGIAVRITSSKSLTVQFRYPTTDEWTTVMSATAGEIGSWRHVTVRFEPNGDRTTSIEIRTNFGASKRMGRATLPWWTETQPMQKAVIDLRGNNVGGVIIAFPAQHSQTQNYTPNANISGPVQMASLRGSPAIAKEPAIDLLTKWAEAECAAMWLDEDGIFHWVNRDVFTSGSPVAALTSSNDLLDLSWSHDVQGAAARVNVKYKEVAAQRSSTSRMVVWQGSGQTMEYGDELEEFVSSPEEEIWIKVDGTPLTFQAENSGSAFNKGRGSWIGYTAYNADGDLVSGERVGYVGAVQALGGNTWKITQSWVSGNPSTVDHIKLQTQDEGTGLKRQWQGVNLPILRAQLRLTMADADVTADVGGPRNAPDLTHETGWWIQGADQARSLAFWLAQQTARPLPVVDGVEVVADPRLQLGDKVTVTDTHRTGLRITGVITEINQGIGPGDHSMTLRLLVTMVEAIRPTLFEYDAIWAGAQLVDRDATWSAQTLGAFDTAPLKR